MTPKEKAEELYWTYYQKVADGSCPEYNAKECALIAVNEIIPIIESYEDALSASQKSDALDYWNEVKQEINKL